MSQTDLEYLLVGSVTKDLLPDDSHVIGGTITYAATVIKYLGGRPTIITAASSDFIPPAYLADLDWRILPSPETTTFRNEYTPQGRRQTIGPIARSIRPIDIPTDCQHPTLVHLCPLAQDVEPGVTAVFNNSSLRAATPQGWLRQWDEEGLVSLGNWEKLEKIFSTLQIAVVSIEDIEGNWRIAERWAAHIPILIVTQDKHGCTLFEQGQPKPVPDRSRRRICRRLLYTLSRNRPPVAFGPLCQRSSLYGHRAPRTGRRAQPPRGGNLPGPTPGAANLGDFVCYRGYVTIKIGQNIRPRNNYAQSDCLYLQHY